LLHGSNIAGKIKVAKKRLLQLDNKCEATTLDVSEGEEPKSVSYQVLYISYLRKIHWIYWG